MTGFQAVLLNKPQNVTGGLEYQVEVSGSGWTEWTAGAVMAGHTEGKSAGRRSLYAVDRRTERFVRCLLPIQQNGTWSPLG